VSAESGERATADKGRPQEASHDARLSTIADLGLTYDQSSRYQKLAAMPEKPRRTTWRDLVASTTPFPALWH